MRRIAEILIVAVLLTYMIVSVVSFMVEKSPICDEVSHHIASGYSYVKVGDYRMNPSSPVLIRAMMGVPLLFMDLSIPTDHVSWQTNDSPVFGHLFLYEYNDNADKIVFLSRIPILILSCILALLLYAWARKLYGPGAGMFALFLYTFSPNVLGNSGVAMTDIGGSLFIFLSVFTFWFFLKQKCTSRLILSGIAFGLAQSAKHSAVILLPILALVTIADIFVSKERGGKIYALKGIKELFLILVIGMVTLWGMYGFEFKPLLENAPDIAEKADYIRAFVGKIPFINKDAVGDWAVYCAENVPIPLSSFIVSLLGVIHQVQVGVQPLFLWGKPYMGGIKWYYIFLFLIRVPLAFIILITYSIVLAIFKKRTVVKFMDNFAVILPIFMLLFAVSMSKLQGGIRYLLPIFPFLFIWVSDSINVEFRKKAGRIFKYCFLSVIVVWYASTSIMIRPHYLAYFNELVGGPGGEVYKISPDMDWGQDLELVSRYMEENNIDEIKMWYFGTADPSYYGMNFKELTPEDIKAPSNHVYVISARNLPHVEWTDRYQPTDKAGYSIFIYDLRGQENR